jgi:prepilin-type N-terminal cleavage/methylation domain-containing protein
MKANQRKAGFTLIELLVVIFIVATLAAVAWAAYGALMMPPVRAKQAASQAATIHKWIVAYALDGGGAFPISEKSSNEAFRELFKKPFGADEMQFYIPGDPYHNSAKDHKPDGDKGREPDYAQALETGECAFAYVSGLTESDEGRIPLLANGFGPSPGVWSRVKTERGGVFQGKYAVVCRVTGSVSIHALKDGELMIKEYWKGAGQEVNIFSPDFDTPSTILNPM